MSDRRRHLFCIQQTHKIVPRKQSQRGCTKETDHTVSQRSKLPETQKKRRRRRTRASGHLSIKKRSLKQNPKTSPPKTVRFHPSLSCTAQLLTLQYSATCLTIRTLSLSHLFLRTACDHFCLSSSSDKVHNNFQTLYLFPFFSLFFPLFLDELFKRFTGEGD